MSLITRCPSCGTMFKVVPDQLKIAQGWVRCGHCADVFDARQSMQAGDAGKLSPDPGPDQLPAASAHAQTAAVPALVEGNALHPGAAVHASIGNDSIRPVLPRAVPRWISDAARDSSGLAQTNGGQQLASRAGASVAEWDHAPPDEFDPAAWKAARTRHQKAEPGSDASARAVTEAPAGLSRPAALDSPSSPAPLAADAPGGEPPHPAALRLWGRVVCRDESEDESYISYAFDDSEYLASAAASAALPIQSPPADSSSELSFVREARRGDFWRQRRIRAGLALLALLLVATLALQAAVQYRDEIAALAPESRPVLNALCEVADCVIKPLRRIDSVVIDSSTFNKLGNDAFRLSFVLKNTATTALRIPSLEVTLTDLQNQVVTRRVVSPSQFGVAAPTIGARTEMAGVLNIQVASEVGRPAAASSPAAGAPSGAPQLSVAGYRVLAFYP